MANNNHLEILEQGTAVWNKWRQNNPGTTPDLRKVRLSNRDLAGIDLSNANLEYAELHSVDLRCANLTEANLYGANLSPVPLEHDESVFVPTNLTRATLTEATLNEAVLVYTWFVHADLIGAQLGWTNLFGADLSNAKLMRTELNEANLNYARLPKANLTGAYLTESMLVKTNFKEANLTGCEVYGVAAWDVDLDGATQSNLIITSGVDEDEPVITVDNLELAQFIYLLINNQKIRQLIDTVTSKVVLILGRFTEERKGILDALRDELRRKDYVPVLFDFERPSSRDLTETVSTLAHMARFVIADITDPRSVPQELQRIIPDLRSVPIQPLLEVSDREWGMFADFKSYPWVLEPYWYRNLDELLLSLKEEVINPAERKAKELTS